MSVFILGSGSTRTQKRDSIESLSTDMLPPEFRSLTISYSFAAYKCRMVKKSEVYQTELSGFVYCNNNTILGGHRKVKDGEVKTSERNLHIVTVTISLLL